MWYREDMDTADAEQQYFGYYATAEEAALEYARHVGSEQAAQEAAEAAPPMTAEEALAKAEDEGLVLVRSGNTVGYKGVGFQRLHSVDPG